MKRLLLASAALVAATAVHAQSDLTESDVQNFINPLAERAERAVAEGDWKGIQTFISKHVRPEATLGFVGGLTTSMGPTMRYELAMSGRDYARFAGLMTMAPHMSEGAETISGYSATVRLMEVHILPNGQAEAVIAFFESGAIDLSNLPGGAGEAHGAEMGTAVFASTAECQLRLAGSGEELQITMAACETHTSI